MPFPKVLAQSETHSATSRIRLGLDWFYGISTIVGYLIPNQFLYIQTVLFQTIQFRLSTQFKCQNSSISSNSVQHKYTVQFYLTHRQAPIRYYHSRPEWTGGAMAVKGYSAFPKALELLEPHHQIVNLISDTHWRNRNPLQRCSRCILQSQPTGS